MTSDPAEPTKGHGAAWRATAAGLTMILAGVLALLAVGPEPAAGGRPRLVVDRTVADGAHPITTVLRSAGAVPVTADDDCVRTYPPAGVSLAGFAFDGTVAGIAPARGSSVIGALAVTFAVHEWFVGGSGPRATVVMAPPLPQPVSNDVGTEWGPSYIVGTRLLVSGTAADPAGPTLEQRQRTAWACGFTLYYNLTNVGEWRRALMR